MRKYASCSIAAVLAVGATLGAVRTSEAAAFPVDTVTSRIAAPQDVVEARYYGGGAFFAGAALGLFGAAIAAPYYYGGYYPSYYYPGYAYAPYWNYGYWGYPGYRYYGYRSYPRYWHYRYRRWR